MRPFIALHKIFGSQQVYTFLQNAPVDLISNMPENTFLISDVKAVGGQGIMRGMLSSLDSNSYLISHVVLLLDNHIVLNIGGWHGYFLTSVSKQKREFERLYAFLAICFDLGFEHNHPRKNINHLDNNKTLHSENFSTGSLFLSKVFSYNYKHTKNEYYNNTYKFKEKNSDVLNIGFGEFMILEGLSYVIIGIVVLFILWVFLSDLSFITWDSILFGNIMLAIGYSSFLRYSYIMYWFGYWGLIKKFPQSNYFQFSSSLEENISD